VASVTLFKSRNYKLCVSLEVSSTVLSPVRAVFDTGAGPNIVRDDILTKGWERILIPSQPFPWITNASGKRMPVRGLCCNTYRSGTFEPACGLTLYLDWEYPTSSGVISSIYMFEVFTRRSGGLNSGKEDRWRFLPIHGLTELHRQLVGSQHPPGRSVLPVEGLYCPVRNPTSR
jgi:hypothetical protein